MVTADSVGNLTLNGPITFTGDVSGQTNRTLNNTAPVTVTVNALLLNGVRLTIKPASRSGSTSRA